MKNFLFYNILYEAGMYYYYNDIIYYKFIYFLKIVILRFYIEIFQ